ncbi:MAG: ParA family protein [Candidatus Margulisbacteria bacterium]|nr:ParA family protein [Candidatus Margulisiibacteriota bacterium]
MNKKNIYCIVNQKGGVGKTTTAVSLASILGKKNHKTLLIDLDPQANATSGLGLYDKTFTYTVYDVLLKSVDVNKAIYPTAISDLYILPSTKDLAGAEIELVSEFNRERFLQVCLSRVQDMFEYIIIDCPPSLGLLTINALTASHYVLIPVQSEYYALEGLARLTGTIDLVKKALNPELQIRGIVVTMFDKRVTLSRQVEEEAREYFKEKVFQTVIPRNVRLSEAPSFGEPIIIYDKKSKGAKAYKNLVKEIFYGQ